MNDYDLIKTVWCWFAIIAATIVLFSLCYLLFSSKPILRYDLSSDNNGSVPVIRVDVDNGWDGQIPLPGITYERAFQFVDSLNSELLRHPRIKP